MVCSTVSLCLLGTVVPRQLIFFPLVSMHHRWLSICGVSAICCLSRAPHPHLVPRSLSCFMYPPLQRSRCPREGVGVLTSCSWVMVNLQRSTRVCALRLQRCSAEEGRPVGWTESERCCRAVTRMTALHRRCLCVGQGGCCSATARGNIMHDVWRLC